MVVFVDTKNEESPPVIRERRKVASELASGAVTVAVELGLEIELLTLAERLLYPRADARGVDAVKGRADQFSKRAGPRGAAHRSNATRGSGRNAARSVERYVTAPFVGRNWAGSSRPARVL